MVQPIDDPPPDPIPSQDDSDDDDPLGEAIEAYLALVETHQAPGVEEFVARYPGLEQEIREALEGLELIHGLMGVGSASGSGLDLASGNDRRLESGRRIAGYRVVRELGRGGMGTVYEAVHMGLDRPVALKVLGIHVAPDSTARRRFLNEARTAAGLHHTHIVPVFDVGQIGGLCYYAMQRIEGSGLDRVLRHLRRTRLRGAGEPGARFASLSGSSPQEISHVEADTSSVSSRLSRLWLRLSPGWPWREPRYVRLGPGRGARQGHSKKAVPQRALGNGANSQKAPSDSTASWVSSGARQEPAASRPGAPLAPAPLAPAALATMTASDQCAGRLTEEEPPYDPPTGSAYFRWVAAVGLQAADALAHAHHLGVIHRDVKPSNLLVDTKGAIWVTDFGLARRLADPGLTHHDSLLGTPRYMSPEQARTGSIDGRTDVYSLGATLYELLTLRPPFDGKSAAELIDQIGQQEPALPRSIDPRIPRDLETIVLKALAKLPVDRYATAAELGEDLVRFLNREPVKARRISPFGRLWRVARRHPGITTVSAAAAAAIVAIATFAYVRVASERDQAVVAKLDKERALRRTEEANEQKIAAMREKLLPTVELVGLSGAPNRRSRGLELIREGVGLGPDAAFRSRLRDEAVKLLALREVEPHPELGTGRAHGLAFSSNAGRLAVLSEDDEEIAFWDVGRGERASTLSLRAGLSTAPGPPETSGIDTATGERAEPEKAAGLTANAPPPGRSGSTPLRGAATLGERWNWNWYDRQRLAQFGASMAVVLPDDKGLGLIDLLSGAPPRILNRPDHIVLSVLGDPAGRRFVTIESVPDETRFLAREGRPAGDEAWFRGEIQVNLWDPDHLERPIATLPWRSDPSPRRTEPAPRRVLPLVAMSPDGKTVAVAPANLSSRDTKVKLFSAVDGQTSERNEIQTQTSVSALALGPDDLLVAASVTPAGPVIRFWDLETKTFLTSLTPATLNFTRLMRFSPQGTLLAIAGVGPIELWDPVAHSLVAVLRTSDQASDVAFAPDGRTLAAVGRSAVTSVWTVHDPAVRTQLSGLDSRPSALAFRADGTLAGCGWNGDFWLWRAGRCPEVSAQLPQSAAVLALPATASSHADPPRGEARGGDGGRRRSSFRERFPSATSLAYDVEGRLIAHDARGLRMWPAGANALLTPTFVPHPIPRAQGAGRAPTTLMAKTEDGRIMALVRSSAVFLWRALAPDRMVPVVPPRPQRVDTALGKMSGPPRAPTPIADTLGPRFRAVQLAPRGERLYLLELEQSPIAPGLLRVWDLESTAGESPIQARAVELPVPRAGAETNRIALRGDNLVLRGDGAVLAVGDRSGSVTILDTARGTVLARIKPSSQQLEGFTLAMAFSHDGRLLAVGSQEGTISIWSVAPPTRPQLLLHLPGHRGPVSILAFDAESRRLASTVVRDPLVEVWDLDVIGHELASLRLVD